MMPAESPSSASPISEKMEKEKSDGIKFDKSLITEENVEESSEDNAVKEANAGGFSWYSSWGTSLLQSAKEKTMSTYELVKKDLGEFKDAVTEEAKTVASSASTAIYEQANNLGNLVQDQPDEETVSKKESSSESEKQQKDASKDDESGGSFLTSWVNPSAAANAGKWVQSVATSVTKVLVIDNAAEDEEKFEIPITSESISLSASRLHAIQSDPRTYSEEPEGAHELFDDWLEGFDMATKDDEISELLGKNAQIRTIYAQLVPSKVSNVVFWEHYFYRIHQFELDEARRASLLKRTSKSEIESAKEKLRQKTSWEDSDEEDSAAIDKILEEEFGEKKKGQATAEPVTDQPGQVSSSQLTAPVVPKAKSPKTGEKSNEKKKGQKGKGKKGKGKAVAEPSTISTESKPTTASTESKETENNVPEENVPSVEAPTESSVVAKEKPTDLEAAEQKESSSDGFASPTPEKLDCGDVSGSRLSVNGGGNGVASSATSDHDSWSVCSGKEIMEEIPSPDVASIVSGSAERISNDDEEEEENAKEETPEPTSDIENEDKSKSPSKISPSEKPKPEQKQENKEDNDDWIDWDD